MTDKKKQTLEELLSEVRETFDNFMMYKLIGTHIDSGLDKLEESSDEIKIRYLQDGMEKYKRAVNERNLNLLVDSKAYWIGASEILSKGIDVYKKFLKIQKDIPNNLQVSKYAFMQYGADIMDKEANLVNKYLENGIKLERLANQLRREYYVIEKYYKNFPNILVHHNNSFDSFCSLGIEIMKKSEKGAPEFFDRMESYTSLPTKSFDLLLKWAPRFLGPEGAPEKFFDSITNILALKPEKLDYFAEKTIPIKNIIDEQYTFDLFTEQASEILLKQEECFDSYVSYANKIFEINQSSGHSFVVHSIDILKRDSNEYKNLMKDVFTLSGKIPDRYLGEIIFKAKNGVYLNTKILKSLADDSENLDIQDEHGRTEFFGNSIEIWDKILNIDSNKIDLDNQVTISDYKKMIEIVQDLSLDITRYVFANTLGKNLVKNKELYYASVDCLTKLEKIEPSIVDTFLLHTSRTYEKYEIPLLERAHQTILKFAKVYPLLAEEFITKMSDLEFGHENDLTKTWTTLDTLEEDLLNISQSSPRLATHLITSQNLMEWKTSYEKTATYTINSKLYKDVKKLIHTDIPKNMGTGILHESKLAPKKNNGSIVHLSTAYKQFTFDLAKYMYGIKSSRDTLEEYFSENFLNEIDSLKTSKSIMDNISVYRALKDDRESELLDKETEVMDFAANIMLSEKIDRAHVEELLRIRDVNMNIHYGDIPMNKLFIGFSKHKLEDYFIGPNSCIMYGEELEKEGLNNIRNLHSTYLNIFCGVNKPDKVIGRIPLLEVIRNKQKALYVATGIYTSFMNMVKDWPNKTYSSIIEFAKQNTFNNIIFDINPFTYNKLTHRFANHVASMNPNTDTQFSYEYSKQSGMNSKDWNFILKKANFIKINPLVNVEGKLFLESLLENPTLEKQFDSEGNIKKTFLERNKTYYVAGINVET